MRPMKLIDALPELVADLESALARLGRPDLARQLRQLTLERWRYDEYADTTYLELTAAGTPDAERLSLYDELGVNVDMDRAGRVVGLEILEGSHVASLLSGE